VALSQAPLLLTAEPPVVPADVQTTIRERVDYGYAPGIVLGLRNQDGTTLFAYGHTDRAAARPVDENTIFEIGSVTKVFTATAFAHMAARGEVGLNDLVQTHVPTGIQVPTYQGTPITLTHLATHTATFPHSPNNLSSTDGNNPFTGYTVDAVFDYLSTYVLPRRPGTLYEYSNYGAGLLGYLLAVRANTDYETLIRQLIADPLGLTDTTITLTADQRTRLAHGYSGVVPIPEFDLPVLEGAGALRSTVSDILTFLQAHRGWLDTSLQPAMATTQTQRVATPTPGLGVGLGWHLLNLPTGTAVWHDGATIGHRAFAGFLREGNSLVVVLGNSDFQTLDIGLHLLDPAVPLTTVRRPLVLSPETLRHYVGLYALGQNDRFTITLRDEHLVLSYAADLGRSLTLYPMAPNRFYLTFPEAQVTFTTNSAGHATSLAWQQDGQNITYPKIRQPTRLLALPTPEGLELRIQGDTDREFVVESSPDLETWSDMTTNTIWETSVVNLNSTTATQRFFRVRE